MADPCKAPVFEGGSRNPIGGFLMCALLAAISALILPFLLLAALFSSKARCQLKQWLFRLRNCFRGNADPNIEL